MAGWWRVGRCLLPPDAAVSAWPGRPAWSLPRTATTPAAAPRWCRSASSRLYGKLAGSSAWREDTRLVVTWDEGGGGARTGCCGGLAAGGHVPTIVVGPRLRPGRDGATYDHYALLRSIEDAFGLPYLGHAGDPGTASIPALRLPGR